MTFQKLIYLIDPFWTIYLYSLIAFAINFVLITPWATRKWFNKTVFRTRKVIAALSFIAASFVFLPLLTLGTGITESPSIFYQAFEAYGELLQGIFQPLTASFDAERYQVLALIFSAIYAVFFFAPVLVVAVGLILALLGKTTIKQKLSVLFLTIMMGFVSTIFIILMSFLTWTTIENYNRACDRKVAGISEFYSHVHDLCNQRPDLRECPKNEEELRAFNPDLYDAMKTCTNSIYYFNEQYGQAWFMSRDILNLTAVSRHKNFPGDTDQFLYSKKDLRNLKRLYYEKNTYTTN